MCQEALADHMVERENMELQQSPNLVVACAWITNKVKHMFPLFSHVIKVDIMRGTSKEDWSLLTLQQSPNLFIACAWITNKVKHMFPLFSHVIKVDIMRGTSKED